MAGQDFAGADTQWRFLNSGKQRGNVNMAIDMAMTLAASQGEAPATLRVYGWQPPTISLGYHQSEHDVDLDRCRKDHIDVVLRPTGGRAILHHNELTYAVSVPPNSPFFAEDIRSVYERLSLCLVRSLQRLDINVDFERAKKTPKDFSRGELSALCYASSVQHEIGIGRRKMVGSAQRRINGAVLQHGSILIGDEHLNISRYLAAKDEQWQQRVRDYMQKNTISLNEICPSPVTYDRLAVALKRGFEQELGITFVDSGLTQQELLHVESLKEKFAILNTD